MKTLYLIGGAARSGKSTILSRLIKSLGVHAISTDALRAGVRKAILDESYITVDKLTFSGELIFRQPGEPEQPQHKKKFERAVTEDEITWQTAIGLIEHHDRNGTSLALEGIAITPERVNALKLNNLEIKVIFVGFTEPAAFDHILNHSASQKDWIYTVIYKERGGNDTSIRQWLSHEMEKSVEISKQAQKYNYPFFTLDGINFDNYCDQVFKELLK